MPASHRLRKGRYSTEGGIYLLTSTTANRQPFFADPLLATAAARCFIRPELLKPSALLCWVLMPDHVHWLLQLGPDDDLSAWAQRMKAVSAMEMNRLRGCKESVWQSGFHDRAIRREEDVLPAARYIVANPLRAGLVRRVGDYPYWDAMWLRTDRD